MTYTAIPAEVGDPKRGGGFASRPPHLGIGRRGATVVVTVSGDPDALEALDLGAVLTDIIDGQGNLDVTVELPDVSVVSPHLLDVLLDAGLRTSRRGGRLAVSTAVATWSHPANTDRRPVS